MKLFDIYSKMPWWLQNVACTAAGYRIYLQRYGDQFDEFLARFRQSEWLARESLESMRKERLAHICRVCADGVPFYQRLFEQTNFDPNHFTIEEFSDKIPVLTKADVRAHEADLRNKNFPSSKAFDSKTSGTTGTSVHFLKSYAHSSAQWAVWWRHRMRFGLRPGDKYANFAGRDVVPTTPLEMPAWRRNLAMNQTYFSIFHLTDEFLPEIYEYLNRQTYDYISGYPSALMVLATYMNERGLQLQTPPRAISTGAETLLAFHRNAFRDAFGARVIDQYGLSEGVANISQCEYGTYHVDEDFAHVEFLPIAADQPNVCRIVGTHYFNEAMPLLRYDTGDVATLSDDSCECGRSLKPIAKIDGRIESVIHTPDGRHVGRLDFIFKDTREVVEAQIIQPAVEEIVLKVVTTDDYDHASESNIRAKVAKYLGDDIQLRFDYVDMIPREENGKFRAIISDVDDVQPV